jgi:hypothetical protein
VNEDELRALVRAAIQKHMSAAVPNHRENLRENALLISFNQYTLERANDDTACLIEPAVRCNHCGFCQCHGH